MEKLDKALLTFTKSFLPKDVLKMSEEKQLKYVKEWSNKKLPDIKITKLGNVREKNSNGKWKTI